MSTMLAWLGTYAIHSTVLLIGALIVTRVVRRDAVRDVIWKAAVVGGLVTTTLTMVPTGYTPPVQLRLASSPIAGAPVDVVAETNEEETNVVPRPAAANPTQGSREFPIQSVLLALWGLVAMGLLIRLAMHNIRLYGKLQGRAVLKDGPLPSMLAEIRRRAGFWKPVRLSVSSACATPIALGGSEICLPERFTRDLDEGQQRAAMAHEVAHLIRRDPVWQFIAGVIESVFFFQPMNRVARIRMREAAEHMSDDWAATQLGTPLELARCLGNIASWLGEPVPSGTLAMAEGGSPLIQRVKRLAEWRAPSRESSWAHAAAAALIVLVIGFASPSFTAQARDASSEVVTMQEQTPLLPDSVIRFAGSGASLAQRWAWAHQHKADAYWVGWSFDAVLTRGISSSSGGPAHDHEDANAVAGIVAPSSMAGSAVIVFGFEGNSDKPTAVRVRAGSDGLYLAGRPLFWLGSANGEESILHLRSLYSSLTAPSRSEVAAAYTLHREFEPMMAAMHHLLRNESAEVVRAEAVQWLPRTHPRERRIVGLLADVVMRDASATVQAESVDALAALARAETEGARDALERIANEHKSWKLRSEAAQVLAAMTN